MKTAIIIILLTLSSCGVMKCGDLKRYVDENPAYYLHPLTYPQLLAEKVRCGE